MSNDNKYGGSADSSDFSSMFGYKSTEQPMNIDTDGSDFSNMFGYKSTEQSMDSSSGSAGNSDFSNMFGYKSTDASSDTGIGSNSSSFANNTDSPMSGSDNGFGNNSGSSMNGINNNFGAESNSFGSSNPPYDPDAPLYRPESSYDPYAPMYNPPPAPKVTTAVRKPKQNLNPMVLLAIVLAVIVGVGVYFYITYFGRQSIKQYIDSPKGQTLISELLAEEGSSSQYEVKVYATDNDQLVMEYKLKVYTPVSQTQKNQMKAYIDAAKPMLAKEIQTMMDEADIREFSMVYKYINANGDVFGEYEVFLSDKQ